VECGMDAGAGRTSDVDSERVCIVCAHKGPMTMLDYVCHSCTRKVCASCCQKMPMIREQFHLNQAGRCAHCRQGDSKKSACGHYWLSSPSGKVCEECKQCDRCVYAEENGERRAFTICPMSKGLLCVRCHKKKHTTCEQCGEQGIGVRRCYPACESCEQRVCNGCRFDGVCVGCRLLERTGGRCGICDQTYDAKSSGQCLICRRKESDIRVHCGLCPRYFELCCLHKTAMNCPQCMSQRCSDHHLVCASCPAIVGCSTCISQSSNTQPIRRDLALQCDKCKQATREILNDSDLPRDLQHHLYLYLFDTAESARATHLASIVDNDTEEDGGEDE